MVSSWGLMEDDCSSEVETIVFEIEYEWNFVYTAILLFVTNSI